ncbi:MAG: hypothetical protein WB791_07385 [Waddliaceae bacterium]
MRLDNVSKRFKAPEVNLIRPAEVNRPSEKKVNKVIPGLINGIANQFRRLTTSISRLAARVSRGRERPAEKRVELRGKPAEKQVPAQSPAFLKELKERLPPKREGELSSVVSDEGEETPVNPDLLNFLSRGMKSNVFFRSLSDDLKNTLAAKIDPAADWGTGVSEVNENLTVKQDHIEGIHGQYKREYDPIHFGKNAIEHIDSQFKKDFYERPAKVIFDGEPLPLNKDEFSKWKLRKKNAQYSNHLKLFNKIERFSGREGLENFQKFFNQGLITPAFKKFSFQKPIQWPSLYEVKTTAEGIRVSVSYIIFDMLDKNGGPHELPFTFFPVKVDLSISWDDLKSMNWEGIEGNIYTGKPFNNEELNQALSHMRI